MKTNLLAVLALLLCSVSCSQTTATRSDTWEAPRYAPLDLNHSEGRDAVLSDDDNDDRGTLTNTLRHVLGVDDDCEDYSGHGAPDLFMQRQATGGFMKTGAGGGLSRMP